jgi:nucleoid-associated protein YgaU
MKYIVKEGDTLSEIAERQFGLKDGWTELYRHNRGVIGPNPDLIFPGQELDIPFSLIEFFKDLLKVKVI